MPCQKKPLDFTGYYCWQDHMDYLQGLANSYNHIAEIEDIGRSVEGRILRVIKIGADHLNGSKKPGIWIDGGIHAREWISPAAVEYLVHQGVENFYVQENNNLVENFELYILRIMNADCYARNFLFLKNNNHRIFYLF